MVAVPATVSGVSLTDSTLNDLWLAYATDGSVSGVDAGDVYLRHGDGVSEPPHPSVKLGEANPDDSTANVLANRGASPSFDQMDAESVSVTGEVDAGAVSTGQLDNKVQASTEAELDEALANGRRNIEITDVIDGIASSKVVDTRGTTIYGEGFMGVKINDDVVSAGLQGNIDNGGIINVQARDCFINGIGVVNESTNGGIGIEKSGGELSLSMSSG